MLELKPSTKFSCSNLVVSLNMASTGGSSESCLLASDLVSDPRLCSVLKITQFNDMQKVIAHQIFESDLNMVVSAPTGSGKTLVHELAILRAVQKAASPSAIKCVYIAPNKALCQQKVVEWHTSFSALNMMQVDCLSFHRIAAKQTTMLYSQRARVLLLVCLQGGGDHRRLRK